MADVEHHHDILWQRAHDHRHSQDDIVEEPEQRSLFTAGAWVGPSTSCCILHERTVAPNLASAMWPRRERQMRRIGSISMACSHSLFLLTAD